MEKFISDNGQYREVLTETTLTTPFHQELMQLYNMYALIDGMPEVVARYYRNTYAMIQNIA